MINQLSDAIAALLPAELGKELRNNIDAVIRVNIEKMNLATREKMDLQDKVLRRTQARLGELEKQMEKLEQQTAVLLATRR